MSFLQNVKEIHRIISYECSSLWSRNILNEASVREIHLSQRFLIVLEHDVESKTETLDNIFAILWSNGLISSHVLIRNKSKWTLDTFMPYQRNCFTLDHLHMESFSMFNFTENMSISMEQLYPQKLKDFNQCPLHIAPSVSDPFVILQNTSDGKTQFTGLDIRIISQISKALNFLILYKYSPLGHGMIFENFTVTGNMNLVRNMFLYFIRLNYWLWSLCFRCLKVMRTWPSVDIFYQINDLGYLPPAILICKLRLVFVSEKGTHILHSTDLQHLSRASYGSWMAAFCLSPSLWYY